VFGLWSNDKPDPAFTDRLAGVFAEAWAEPVTFHSPLQDRPFTQTVYLGRTAVEAGRQGAVTSIGAGTSSATDRG
jgi:hypothetical protein